jgi:hypothetical protein
MGVITQESDYTDLRVSAKGPDDYKFETKELIRIDLMFEQVQNTVDNCLRQITQKLSLHMRETKKRRKENAI